MQLTQARGISPAAFGGRQLLYLGLLFLMALLPRLYSVQHLGWNWDSPGSFSLVNFDEGGSCRAALKGFDYSTFIGRQTIALARAAGAAPTSRITAARQPATAIAARSRTPCRRWSAPHPPRTVCVRKGEVR